MIPMEDAILIKAASMRNQDALEKIFDLYASSLYSYACRLCNDPLVADHIVGDAFAKLLEQLSAGKGPTSNLRSYLYQIVYHLIVDEIRASRHSLSLEVADFLRQDQDQLAFTFENQIMLKTLLQTIRRCLTRDQWHVVVLRFVEGLSLRETAIVMGKEIGNIKVIQSRAIGILRKSLTREALRIGSSHSDSMSIAV